MRAESLASLQRAALVAARVLGGQAISARPAIATVHHALRTAYTALSADADHRGSLARHLSWRLPQQQQSGSWGASRGFSAAHAAAAAPAETGLIVTEKAVQVL